MIQTINPYATARTAEIMSRYRPIAPKPETPATDTENGAVPNGIRKSPYLRNVWAHLQARPTRTRKRGRTAAFSPPSVKRTRTCLQGLAPPFPAAKNLAMHGFSLVPNLNTAVTTLAESVAALPLLCCAAAAQHHRAKTTFTNGIDLNIIADQGPEELDLLPQLNEPSKPKPAVISPRPVRPVGSSITVKTIAAFDEPVRPTTSKAAEEVEEDFEAEAMPAIVSDSNNRVRISNSAYKEMVGQPECCWLDCAAGKGCDGGGGKRIGGEVSLQFVDCGLRQSTAGFSCAAEIVWEREGKKMSVNARCSGVKLACEGKDYQFLWRFYTTLEEASKCSYN